MANIVFKNSGLIDLRAICTLGWSVKETDNPIGMFGTGSRYGIATLLRSDHKVTLWRGLDRYAFGTVKVDARAGATFELITMTGPDSKREELAFTTQLGKNWVPWMAFRELHSNALDEGGTTVLQHTPYEPKEDQTAFVVSGKEIEEAYHNRHTIFLESKPVYQNAEIEVHLGESPYVYYRGVRVLDLDKPSLYTYSLLTTLGGLTEDRTLKSESDLPWYLCRFLETCDDTGFLTDLMLAPQNRYEHDLSGYASKGTDAFVSVYAKLRQEGHAKQLAYWANNLYLKLRKIYPLPPPITLSKIQHRQLDKAIAFCKAAGWDVDAYPIICVPQAHGGLLALAEDGKIVLTEKLFDMGVKAIVSAALEEWCHLRFGYKDETRELQTFLFDRLVSAKEEVLNEAL